MSAKPPEPWYAPGLRFACERCGRCCKGPEPGYVWVSDREIARLAAALGLSVEDFTRRYVRRVFERFSLVERANNDCVFYEDGKGCTVYDARPDQCRTFPFWPKHFATEQTWRAAAAECPGIGKGRLHDRKAIETGRAGS